MTLIYTPVVFIISLAGIWLFSRLTSSFAPKAPSNPKGKTDSYACGEDYNETKVEPSYQLFFPFAIFFTIMHVAGLMIATLAAASAGWAIAYFAVLYVVAVGVVLAILYAK